MKNAAACSIIIEVIFAPMGKKIRKEKEKMKKTKFICLIAVLALILTAFTGCIGVSLNADIKADGSGSMTVQVGFTKEAFEEMKASAEEQEGEEDPYAEYKEITINGKTFMGVEQAMDFENLEQLSRLLNGDSSDFVKEDEGAEDSPYSSAAQVFGQNGVSSIYQDEDGHFVLLMNNRSITDAETQDISELTGDDESLTEDMAVAMIFNFPEEVKQVKGPEDGVAISGKTLTLDGMKMANDEDALYAFVTGGAELSEEEFAAFVESSNKAIEEAKAAYEAALEEVTPSFSDVEEGRWFSDAVSFAAAQGLVNGYPDGSFKPLGEISYAEFANMLAKYAGFDVETEAEGAYWAKSELEGCIEKGYFAALDGEVSSATYGAPIDRQTAIAAMERCLAEGSEEPLDSTITAADIPDYSEIAPELQADIVSAYNRGLTEGKDAARTFVPAATLTRAEICQLYMNIMDIF